MEKPKRWQLLVIGAVILLTIYNLLPTFFYYTRSLEEPLDSAKAEKVIHSIQDRVNTLNDDTVAWLHSFSDLLGVKPEEIVEVSSGHYRLSFSLSKDSERFRRFLPRAGAYISFFPSQIYLDKNRSAENSTQVFVRRNLPFSMEGEGWLSYVPLKEGTETFSKDYINWVSDRKALLLDLLSGVSPASDSISSWVDRSSNEVDSFGIELCQELIDLDKSLASFPSFRDKVIGRFFFGKSSERQKRVQAIKAKLEFLSKEGKVSQESKKILGKAIEVLNSRKRLFEADLQPGSISAVNPFFVSVDLDWERGLIVLKLRQEVRDLLLSPTKGEAEALLKSKVHQLLIEELALTERSSGERFETAGSDAYLAKMSPMEDTSGFLFLNLEKGAKLAAEDLKYSLISTWEPNSSDFKDNRYPVVSYKDFQGISDSEKELCLVVYSPVSDSLEGGRNFKNDSLYVIAKGIRKLLAQVEGLSGEAQQIWRDDFERLRSSLYERGFVAYPGDLPGIPSSYKDDLIFESPDFLSNLIKATRESFITLGNKKNGVLPLSTVGQRLIRLNEIEDEIQEDLLRWKEEWQTAQVEVNPENRFFVPKPIKSSFIENIKLSIRKYFRGDDRRVLKWGLDLSGGKAVRVGLVDYSGRPVTQPDDLKQAVEELFRRINRLGVSEQTIRIEDDHLLIEFPGSQHLSASDLIEASAMSFHVVNEKFGLLNPSLRDATNRFLEEVWNEAVVTGKRDSLSIQEIASRRMGGGAASDQPLSRTIFADVLYQEGLRFALPGTPVSSVFDDALSTVVKMRGEDPSEWMGQSHPLLITFHNYALEGASLTNIRVGYDPNQGNLLTFDVSDYFQGRDGNPQLDLQSWSSQFSEESISGTLLENFSRGNGWRMAVVLNGEVISAPSLKGALKQHASISGRFSQREINKLAADLKAGSLTFKPKILSENNISPELGKEDRRKGIGASLLALVLVVLAMIGYYRFAGVVASVAVIFNLLILFGVLQNLDAAITLPGIAGIVLTIGMAVDANVLVFERIKEELKGSGRIASAIRAGYEKAFSAIADSNITTVIAALILVQFDSGPIKAFAVTLIIGICSSMFTALFMTRVFFNHWASRGGKTLSMSSLFGSTHFQFLNHSNKAILLSCLVVGVGTVCLSKEGKSLLGMDFTGGYALTLDHPDLSREKVVQALTHQGASSSEVEVRELSRPSQLRIHMSKGMDEEGRLFYGLTSKSGKNERLDWVIGSLQKEGVLPKDLSLQQFEAAWSEVSGQLSQAMQTNAFFAIFLALISILIYITIRFEWTFALASVVGLVHDVLITLSCLGIFHALGFPVEIDLVVIGGIMTIIGYSLNNTIIIFDRVREDRKLLKRLPLRQIMDRSLNETFSRTVLTSGTTLLVLLALLIFGGTSIFAFSLVMTIGVLFGTVSSVFLAPYVLYKVSEGKLEKA